jgi:hypothetical protein
MLIIIFIETNCEMDVNLKSFNLISHSTRIDCFHENAHAMGTGRAPKHSCLCGPFVPALNYSKQLLFYTQF